MIWPEQNTQWTEDYLQMYVVMQSNKLGLVFHGDQNAAKRKDGSKRKLLGMRAGWPDLCYWTPRLLYIELKTLVNAQSENQKELQAKANAIGIEYHLVKALDGIDCWNKVRGVLCV